MYKSNFITVLKNFDVREFREFGELVHSPFFNKNQSVIKLYDYLKKLYPDFKQETVEKEFVYTKIFHKAEYNDGFMRNIIFNLSALSEMYLKQLNIRRHPAEGSLMLLEELNYRKLEKMLVKSFPQAEKEIESVKGEVTEYYYYKFLYNNHLQHYTNWSRFKNKNMKDYLNENISGGNIYLSHYFLIRTLANYRVFLVKEEAAPPEYDSGFLDALIKYITENDSEFSEVPLIMLHVNEILLLKTKSDKYYFRLKEMLASGKGITRDHRYSLLNILQTYCVHKEFRGDKNITKERFELYKLALENKFHRGTQDIYFDALLFPSIARIAINAGEFDWAEQFMMKYEKELSPEICEVATEYLKSYLLFAKGEFEEGLNVLGRAKSPRHLQYKIMIRSLSLMLFYELSNYDQAEYLMDTFRKYLNKNRKHFNDLRFERHIDFIKHIGALLKIKSTANTNSRELTRVLIELKKNSNVFEREWLLKKAKELEK